MSIALSTATATLATTTPIATTAAAQISEWLSILAIIPTNKTFWAILASGLIIATLNNQFQQKQFRRNIADQFCIKMEESAIAYLKNENPALNAEKYNAYLWATLMYVHEGTRPNTKKRQQCSDSINQLQELDNQELTNEQKQKFILRTLAHFRYHITQ